MAISSLEDVKNLPPKKKALLAGAIYILLGYFCWFFLLQGSWEERAKLSTAVAELKEKIAHQERVVAQRARHLKEVELLKEQFRVALIKLPERKEIPGLLQNVAQVGKTVGMDFVHFEPLPPPPPPQDSKDKKTPDKKTEEQFYETIMIKMTVAGRYHNTVTFFDRVARLPRIINMENIIAEATEKKDRGRLINTSCILKTYMFKESKDKR